MTISLVSCGPSAAGFVPSGPVIAVSRAATLFQCDVWACFDLPVVLCTRPLGSPQLFTIRDTLSSLRRRQKWREEAIEAETLSCPVDRWMLFTAPAALVLAALMGAKRVECWGVDMEGAEDVTGDPGSDRSEARWARERAIWDGVVEWVRGRGVEVSRTPFGLAPFFPPPAQGPFETRG